ncbi:MAG: NAD(P)/FAD-dependent oxidoreductase [Planctomycetes bacterium]|nr:NAD(P)/FAD-dependent oxidoreductase [Planctomycetota bacterium]
MANPLAEPAPPSARPLDVLIVGSGFAGLCLGIRLKEQGRHRFLILEAADSLGGTWRDNTYPGAACDVQSELYSFSFALSPDWTRDYPAQGEILSYMERCAAQFGLDPHFRFGARVETASYHDGLGLWSVRTASGETYRAKALVSACGALSRPSLPAIPGLDEFAGPSWHTSEWRHDVELKGKRVGVIGTGASTIQLVPPVAERCSTLSVFQRTPPWILPKDDLPISPQRRFAFRHLPGAQRAYRNWVYWRNELRVLPFTIYPRAMRHIQRQAERYIEESVACPKLRERLTPDYTIGCKRILISNDYYPTLQRPDVELITDGIEKITPGGVLLGSGRQVDLDALVLATGFHASEGGLPFEVQGDSSKSLADDWSSGPEAYLGTLVAGFPNMFLLVGPNTGLGHSSMILMIESQTRYVLECLGLLRRRRLHSLAVRPAAQARFNSRLQERLAKTVWASGCQSWYQTREGKNTTLWPGFTWEFRSKTRRVRRHDLILR